MNKDRYPCPCTIPISKIEYETITKMCLDKHLSHSSLIRLLLAEAITEYKQKNCSGLYVFLGDKEFKKYKCLYIYIPKEMKDFFDKLALASGLKSGQVARQFLIPKLNVMWNGE